MPEISQNIPNPINSYNYPMLSNTIQEDIKTIANSIRTITERFSGSTIIITGGAGFLGNNFISVFDFLNKNILQKPCRIISIDNFVTGVNYWIEESDYFKTIRHNIKEPLVIEENVDYIIHAAGIASPKFYRDYKIETIDVATFGTKNMLELAKRKNVKSMLFFSSSEAYGDPDPKFVPTPESYFGNVSCIGPRANYDESKRLGETLCRVYFETYDIPVKWVRPFNVYGPGMRKDDYRVIPNFVACALNGKPLPVYGDGKNTRTFCYVTDAITGFFEVLTSNYNGEVFNIGNDKEEITIESLAELIASLFGNNIPIKKTEGPLDVYTNADPKRRCPDITKMRTKLNFVPSVELKTGLNRFIEWARESKYISKNTNDNQTITFQA